MNSPFQKPTGPKDVCRVIPQQDSHGIEKHGKSREFVLVFFPGLEVWNFVDNLEISRKVGKIVASAPPKELKIMSLVTKRTSPK